MHAEIYIVVVVRALGLPSGLHEQALELDMVVAACHRAGGRQALPTGNRWDTG